MLGALLGAHSRCVCVPEMPFKYKLWRELDCRWSLVSDADELFDYPYSQRFRLSDFLAYPDRRDYNAVSVQNLEMISDEPLSKVQGARGKGPVEAISLVRHL